MSTGTFCHFSHLLQVSKNVFEVWCYTICFHDLIPVYSPGPGQTAPRGQNFEVNRKALSLHPFAASFKEISLKSDFTQFFWRFNTCINFRSPGPRRLMKFGFNRPSGFRGDVWKYWHTYIHTTEAYLDKLTNEPKGTGEIKIQVRLFFMLFQDPTSNHSWLYKALRMHRHTDKPKPICPLNFIKVGGRKTTLLKVMDKPLRFGPSGVYC